ncbi:MAG: hypothetical protein ACRYF3_10860 [Janthinobacterium lividum]
MSDEELGAPALGAERTELFRILATLADRIRNLPLARLERPRTGEDISPADHVRAAAQALADLAADAEQVPRRPLPRLAVHGTGDQFAVVCTDLARHANADSFAAARMIATQVRRQL